MPTPQPTKYERIAQSHVDSFQGTYHGSIGAAAIIVCRKAHRGSKARAYRKL